MFVEADFRRNARQALITVRGLSSGPTVGAPPNDRPNLTRPDFLALVDAAADHVGHTLREGKEAVGALVLGGLLRRLRIVGEELEGDFDPKRAREMCAEFCRIGGTLRDYRREARPSHVREGTVLLAPRIGDPFAVQETHADRPPEWSIGVVVTARKSGLGAWSVESLEGEVISGEIVISSRGREWTASSNGLRWLTQRERVASPDGRGVVTLHADGWAMFVESEKRR